MVVRSISHLSFVVAAALVAAPGCSGAQGTDAGSSAKVPPVVEDEVENEETTEPAPVKIVVGTDEVDGAEPAPQAAEVAAPAPATVHDLTSRVVALQTEVEGLKATVAALQQALANSQDPSDLSRSALGAMAEDSQLRSGLAQMLQGKLRLLNETGEPKVVYINGTAWTVLTGETYIFSPVGTVSFVVEGAVEGIEKPFFKGVQEWYENTETGQLELEYWVGETGEAATSDVEGESASEDAGEGTVDDFTETSVMKPLPERAGN